MTSMVDDATPMTSRVFKYLLMLRDGEPVDAAVFITAVPNWHVGEEFMVSRGERFRIAGINDEIDARAVSITL